MLVNNAGAGAVSNRLLLVRFQLAVQRPNRRREWLILCNHSRATAQALGIVSEGSANQKLALNEDVGNVRFVTT